MKGSAMTRNKLFSLAASALLGMGLAAVYSPEAKALPGQCFYSPWGG